MRREYASLRRRPFLTPLWILSLVAILAFAAGAWAFSVATTTLVLVVRPADKASDGTDDPPLSPAGVERAARLARLLGPGPGPGIDVIFVSQYRRSLATAQPLASARGVPVITVPDNDLGALEKRIAHDFGGKRVLVVAHSDTVPKLVEDLGEGGRVAGLDANDYGTAYLIAMPRFGRPTVLRLTLP